MANVVFLPAFLLLLTCCQTGSLLMVFPTEQSLYTEDTAVIECHFTRAACPDDPTWRGPALIRTTPIHNRERGISTLRISNLTGADEGEYDCECREQPVSTSTLTVLRAPSFFNVEQNQEFYRGDTVTVKCPAEPGDPMMYMQWTRNGFSLPNPKFLHIRNSSHVLNIANISNSDAGTYECSFHPPNGRIHRTISVTVVDPPPERPTFIQPSAHDMNIPFRQPLNLECVTEPPAVNYFWTIQHIGREEQRINNRPIQWPSNTPGGLSGYYTCTANISSGVTDSFTVHVQQINIPPQLERHNKKITTFERDAHELHPRFHLPVVKEGLTLQWLRDNKIVDFSSRISFNVTQDGLRIEISNAQVDDAGDYSLNISNDHGSDVLNVTINVIPLQRQFLKLKFANVACDTLEDHSLDVATQVWRQYCAKQRCDDLIMESSTLTCRATSPPVLTLNIIVFRGSLQDITNDVVSVDVGSARVSATVCQSGSNEDSCGSITTPPQIAGPPDATTVIAVVCLALVMVVVLVALLFTIIIYKSRRNHCHGDLVGGRHADVPEQVVVHNDNCKYSRREPLGTDPSVTSVHEPFLPQPLGQAPRRPQHLMIRSLSHPSSRKTPLRTV